MQILNKQNATQGNFKDQNLNNRNSFVSKLRINCPYLSIPHMEIPFQFNNHTTKTIIIFKVQKTHIMLLQLIHIHTVQYLLDEMKGHIIKNKLQGKPLFLIGDLNINSLDYSRNTHVCDVFIYLIFKWYISCD